MTQIIGALIWTAILVAVVFYQLRHGSYLEAVGAALLAGLLLYTMVSVVRCAVNGEETPARCRVGGWAPPRSTAVDVLVLTCIVATVFGWMIPHHWYITQGTVGSVEVLQRHEWWRLATSAFLHANYMHLYFNMLALWVLGREIDRDLGTVRFVAIYLVAALGGGLAVVAAGQERTLGASGAIFGLMGAALYFGFHALKAGHRIAARRMLLGASLLIGINLLFSFSVPHISIADHVGGLVTGFVAAAILGIPKTLLSAWELSDRCPEGAWVSYDRNAKRYSYHGPVDFARRANIVNLDDPAKASETGWSPYLEVSDLNPRTPIDCYLNEPDRLYPHTVDESASRNTVP